jgi:hypothetical protein
MSRTYHHGSNREQKIRIRVVKRARPDFKRLSRTIIDLAEAEREKEAECEDRKRQQSKKKGGAS